MEAINKMRLVIPSKSVNEGFARAAVAVFAAQLDPTCDRLAELKTAVSEAVTNCIVHAYRETGVGQIYITAELGADGWITVRVADRGCGIPDVKQAMEPLYTTASGQERSGLGFSVMRSFCDGLRVRSTPGRGTSVTLKKQMR